MRKKRFYFHFALIEFQFCDYWDATSIYGLKYQKKNFKNLAGVNGSIKPLTMIIQIKPNIVLRLNEKSFFIQYRDLSLVGIIKP